MLRTIHSKPWRPFPADGSLHLTFYLSLVFIPSPDRHREDGMCLETRCHVHLFIESHVRVDISDIFNLRHTRCQARAEQSEIGWSSASKREATPIQYPCDANGHSTMHPIRPPRKSSKDRPLSRPVFPLTLHHTLQYTKSRCLQGWSDPGTHEPT